MPFDANLPALELEDLEIIYISTLEEVIKHLSGQNILPFYPQPLITKAEVTCIINFTDYRSFLC
jgi:magnesium chelatase family protein